MVDHGGLVNKLRKFLKVSDAMSNDDSLIEALRDDDIEVSGSLVKINSLFSVRPMIILNEELKYADQTNMKNILDAQIKIFISNYVQAFLMLINIENKSAKNTLTILNTVSANTLDMVESFVKKADAGFESYDYLLDSLDSKGSLPIAGYEAKGKNKKSKSTSTKYSLSEVNKLEQTFIVSHDIEIVTESKKGEKRIITIPLVFYPRFMYTNSETLINSLLSENVDASFFSRYEGYRAGAINLSDLIFATDLIKKVRDKKIKNENDVAKLLKGIQLSSTIADIYKGTSSFAKNYNMYILTTEDKVKIDTLLSGNVYAGSKQELINAFYAFSISYVDLLKEQLVVTLDYIPGVSVINFKQLKTDKGDLDINNIFKSLLTNKQPF